MIPLLGFAPDLESPTPGVITDCSQMIPYRNGMEGAPTNVTPVDVPALSNECIGAAVVTKLDATRRIFAGTTTDLYELVSGAWVDVSSATYNGGADTRWSFAQFGDLTIAANRADTLQYSTSGTFATIGSGAPKAEIVFSVGPFVMALNVNDGAEKPDGWHCSAAFDGLDWNESVTTQSASGRLVATPGRLTAGLRLGEYAVAYKSKSIYLGQYVGAPAVWDWILVPGGEAGCIGKEAICDIGGAHFFIGEDNIWLFDGSRPIPIADNTIRQWFFDNSSPANRFKTKCVFDRQENRVWVFYPSNSSDTCDSTLVYHVITKQWGCADREIQAALNYVASGVTYDTWDDYGATYDDLPDISYDSQFWISGGQTLSVFNTSNQLQLVNGDSTTSSFASGDAGDDDQISLLTQVRLRFSAGQAPTDATMQNYYKDGSGDAYTTGSTTSISDSKFDVFMEARWHKAEFMFTGPVRVTHIRPILKPAGER